MHSTLTVNGNLKLVALWSAVLAACIAAGISEWWPVVGIVALAGVVAGVLQAQAIRRCPWEFRAALSAREVRQALMWSGPGKASVLLLWAAAIALLALLTFVRPSISVQALLAAYAAFSLGREVLALRAVQSLVNS